MINQKIITHEEKGEENNERKILFLLCSVVFFVVCNAVMINVARPGIVKHFWEGEKTLIIVTWVVTGYMLSFGIFNTIDGRIADVLGVRRIFMIGTAILGISSLVIGFAPSLNFIIAFRVIQGCGCAALPALSTAIIARVFPPKERGWAMGTIVASTGVASIAGLFLGGFLVQKIGWRAVFFFTSLVLLALPIAMKVLPKTLDKVSKDAKFDFVGALLLAVGIGSLFYSFVFVEQTVRGNAAKGVHVAFEPSFLIFPGIGIICMTLFGIWIHRAAHPLIPPFIFRSRGFITAALTTSFANVSRFGAYVMVPQFLSQVHGVKPIVFALVLLPGELGILFLSSLFGKYADKHGTRLPIIVGSVALIAANLLFAFKGNSSIPLLAVAMGIYGIGLTAIQTPMMSSVSKILPRRMTGVGMGIFMMLFFIGGGIGAAIWNTAFAFQSPDAISWIGITGSGIRYSNSVLIIGILPVIGLMLMPFHPKLSDSEMKE